MNGDTAMPLLTFGPDCTYDVLDSILNGNERTGFTVEGTTYGWAVRIWLKQGVCITAMWGWTDPDDDCVSYTKVLAWCERDRDYNKPIVIPTDDITRLEIL